MPKYLSGRVKRTPQGALTTDRYLYLGLDQAEPNLGDPPELDPIPSGTKYQIVSLIDRPGERFWQEVGGGLIPGTITVRDEGLVVPRTDANPNLGISSITDINFVGAAVTVVGFIKPDGDAGTAVTVTISAPGDNHGIIFNNDGEFDTSPFLTFDNSVGIGSVGIGTTSPTQSLHVVGNFRLEGTFFDEENGSGSTGDLLIKTVNGGLKYASGNSIQAGAGGTITQVQFHDSTGLVGGADNFVFDFTNNRIGIGSTQPDRLLDVLGNSRFTGITTFTDDVTFVTNNTNNILFDKSDNSLIFGNNVKAKFGGDGDTSIYHNDTDFYIDNSKGNIFLRVKDTETALKAIPDSGVELYFDAVKKFETTASGIDVFGMLNVSGISTLSGQVGFGTHATFPDNAIIKLGDSEELELSHQGDGETVIRENGSGNLNILGSDIIFKNSSLGSSKKYAEFKNGDSINLFFNNSEKFQTTGAGVSVTGITSTTDLEVRQYVASDLVPDIDAVHDLGSQTRRWNNVYASNFVVIQDIIVTGDLNVLGITTTKNLNVTGIATIKDLDVDNLYVTGISTFVGITTQQSTLFTNQISNVGVSTFFNTVNVKTAGGSVIQDASGTLDVRANIISLENNAGLATFARFSNGGSAELWYNNNKTFETVAFGATVSGTFFTNQLDVAGFSTFRDTIFVEEQKRLRFGDANRRIYADGVDLNVNASGSSNLNLKACADGVSTGKLNIVNVGSGVTINPAGSVDIYHSPNKRLSTTGIGITVFGNTETQTLNVTGVSTFVGITTQQSTLFSTQLSNSGVSTFFNTVFLNHSGGASIIQDSSGTLDIRSNTLNLKNGTNTGIYISAVANGEVILHYANANKLETTTTGITVTGNANSTKGVIVNSGISTFGGHLYPSATDTHNLGKDATLRWNKVYAAEYYGVFKGSIGPNIPVDRADTVKITDDTTVAGTHYIHFGDDATTDNYDAVEVDSTGLKYQDKVLVANKISSGISTLGIATATDLFVSGISTFVGITTQKSTLFSKQISNAGVSTFFNTINVKTAGGSVIQDASGTLSIRSNVINLKNGDASESLANFNQNGSVELFHDDSRKFQTLGFGVTIFNDLHVKNIKASGIVTATDFDSLSDRALKTNIQVIDNPIEKIMKIDGVSFNWKATNKPSLGVIADNVQDIIPDIVSDTSPKSVNYNGLVGLLIEVVKNQQDQIDELRGLIDK